jgi:glycosyltransferase involved in cell wall biosynthesis
VGQTLADFECIVVDDASDRPLAGDFGDRRVRTIRRLFRGGPAAARNTGLDQARGRYVAFLDDDDLFSANRLALGTQGIATTPLAICGMKVISARRRTRPWSREAVPLRRIPHLGQVTMLREFVPLFDERYLVAEDVEWWIRASKVGTSIEVPGIGYIKRTRRRPRLRQNEELEAELRSLLLLLETHSDYFEGNRKAAAWRWKRVGRVWRRLGDRPRARSALTTATALDPSAVGRLDLVEVTLPVPRLILPRI